MSKLSDNLRQDARRRGERAVGSDADSQIKLYGISHVINQFVDWDLWTFYSTSL